MTDGPGDVELDLENTPAAKNGIPRRAATEGRPYSTFDQILSLGEFECADD